ncbi:tRNA-splicing endonuclease subunit Sen2-like [Ptychodera flava]|uniref:tRNA-splicing endonuclease subunit Sen2-like n=1 Tax=Ptychodera flava TaxID=63121 RepID=UPI00396A3248
MPASGKLPEPRKKKRIHQAESSPFPVPIASIDGKPASSNHWYYYTGQLVGNCVLVKKPGDITFLYKMGFFGKGILSRSKPEHKRFISSYQGVVRKRLPPKERRFQQQRFQQVRKQRYMRHLQWFNQFKQQQKELSDSQDSQDKKHADSSESVVIGKQETENTNGKIDSVCSTSECEPKPKRTKSDDIMDYVGSCTTQSGDVIDTSECVTAGADAVVETDHPSETCSNPKEAEPMQISRNKDFVTAEADFADSNVKMDTDSAEISLEYANKFPEDCNEDSNVKKEGAKPDEDDSSECSDFVIADSDDSDEEVAVVTGEQKEVKEREVQEVIKSGSKHVKKQKVVKKKDPYPIQEYLELSLEEAYFLAFGLGCLTVKDEDGNSLNLTSMWQKFCTIQPNFVPMYTVYHNIRSKGWVPKTGIKFGSDFIVYKQGPPFYHSTYSVLVSMVDEATLLPCGPEERPLSWPVISGMNRVTEHAAKALLFCYVLKPPNMTDQEMLSPQCLQRFKVQEMLMRRWIPSRERENKRFCPMIS